MPECAHGSAVRGGVCSSQRGSGQQNGGPRACLHTQQDHHLDLRHSALPFVLLWLNMPDATYTNTTPHAYFAAQLSRCLATACTCACCATFQHPALHMIMSCCIDIHKLADSQTAHVCRGRAEAFQTAVTCKRTWTTCTPSATSRRRRSRSCRTLPRGSWVRSKLACLLSVCSRLLGQNVDVICWLVLPHDIA